MTNENATEYISPDDLEPDQVLSYDTDGSINDTIEVRRLHGDELVFDVTATYLIDFYGHLPAAVAASEEQTYWLDENENRILAMMHNEYRVGRFGPESVGWTGMIAEMITEHTGPLSDDQVYLYTDAAVLKLHGDLVSGLFAKKLENATR